jgi:hypothetical protein
VEQLEGLLVAAGWSLLPAGSAWYAKRFVWEPVAPEVGKERRRSAAHDVEDNFVADHLSDGLKGAIEPGWQHVR